MISKYKRLLIIVFIFSLAGCGPLLTKYASSSKFDKPNGLTDKPNFHDEYSQDLANRFGVMALFAELAYRRDLGKNRKEFNECDYAGNKESNSIGPYIFPALPFSLNGGRWEIWRGASASSVKPCFSSDGLFYETYVYKNNQGVVEEAVISFRGTENRASEIAKDWVANFSAAFGVEPKQYKLSRELIVPLIEKLQGLNEKINIFAVGHSLGGGLAQQAGYLSRNINAVYSFNASPVTNWTQLRLDKKVDNEYPIIYRVFHGGEFLEKIRFFTTNATSAQYRRYDIGVQYEGRASVGGHSMLVLTCSFAEVIAKQNLNAKLASHHYEPEYIKEELFGEGRMCN